MKTQASIKVPSSAGYSILPPPNFSYVEENICRCCFPVTRSNVSFIQSISVNYILNVSGKKFESAFQSYCDEKGIEVNQILPEGESPPFNQVSSLEGWIAAAISVILSKASVGVVMVVGSSDSYYDSLIIACLRGLQEWSYVSIMAEFRHNTWPHKLPDLEQIIEIFRTSAVDLTSCTPEFLAIHDNFKEEEDKLVKRHMAHQVTDCQSENCPVPPSPAAQEEPERTEPALGDSQQAGDGKQSIQPCAVSAWCCAQDTGDAVEDVEGSQGASQDPDAAAVDATEDTTSVESAPRRKRLTSEECEQRRIDAILHKLFFSSKNLLISEGITYDGSVSLINDKDEED